MSYNRIRYFLPGRHRHVGVGSPPRPAFVSIPAGVVCGELTVWQRELYSWAHSTARASMQARRYWRLRQATENN